MDEEHKKTWTHQDSNLESHAFTYPVTVLLKSEYWYWSAGVGSIRVHAILLVLLLLASTGQGLGH